MTYSQVMMIKFALNHLYDYKWGYSSFLRYYYVPSYLTCSNFPHLTVYTDIIAYELLSSGSCFGFISLSKSIDIKLYIMVYIVFREKKI